MRSAQEGVRAKDECGGLGAHGGLCPSRHEGQGRELCPIPLLARVWPWNGRGHSRLVLEVSASAPTPWPGQPYSRPPHLLLSPVQFRPRLSRAGEQPWMWALCSPSILASPVLAALAPHSPGCLHFPHQSACNDVLAFSLPDSQAREPLRAAAKAACRLLVSSGLCSEHAGELSRRTPCPAREADAETVTERRGWQGPACSPGCPSPTTCSHSGCSCGVR